MRQPGSAAVPAASFGAAGETPALPALRKTETCFAVRAILVQFARMKILVIGSGGREHALVWKLAQSAHATQLWCAPGNAGIEQERTEKTEIPVECVNIGAEDLPKLLAFAREKKIDFTVVGPDNPLALGIVDLFQ